MTAENNIEKKPTDAAPKLGKTLTCDRQLWEARYSPCGKFLVAGGYDATIRRWDLTAEALPPLALIAGHNGWVFRIAFAAERLISSDSWGRLAAWNYAEPTPKPIWQHEQAHNGWIRSLAVSPDGATIATCGPEPAIKLWSAADGKPAGELQGHPDRLYSLAFHPDGRSLVAGDLKGVIRHWDLAEKKIVRQLDAAALYRLHQIQECGGVRCLAFDATGERLLAAGQKTPSGAFATGLPCVLVYDWKEGKQTHELQHGTVDDGFVYDARFHPSGYVMATSSQFPGKGHSIFWRPGEPKPFFIGQNLSNGHSVSLRPDGKQLALLIDVSPNANGRQLKEGKYPGGTAKVQFLDFPAA